MQPKDRPQVVDHHRTRNVLVGENAFDVVAKDSSLTAAKRSIRRDLLARWMGVADAFDELQHSERLQVELDARLVDSTLIEISLQLPVGVPLAMLEHRVQSVREVVVAAILRYAN